MEAEASAVALGTFNGVINWFKRLPSRPGSAVSGLWGHMKGAFQNAKASATRRAREARDGVARLLRGIPGAAGRAVAGLWGRMKGTFQTALDGVQRFAEKIAAAVARIAGLKAKASGATQAAAPAHERSVTTGHQLWLVLAAIAWAAPVPR
jgi:hypothetical protein